jgi:adenine-specific DNA-methyltransferase
VRVRWSEEKLKGRKGKGKVKSNMEQEIKKLMELVELFGENLDPYKSGGGGYNQANVRVNFIDRFFEEVLNWDVRNLKGYAENYREVVREDRVRINTKLGAK